MQYNQPRPPAQTEPRQRRPWVIAIAVLSVALVAGLSVGLWAFQPWKKFTSSTLDEPLPGVAEPAEPAGADDRSDEPDQAPAETESATPSKPVEPVVLSEGAFVAQEYSTSGTAAVIELPDGSRVLRLADLATSDGPDVHVWITDQEAGGDDGKYENGRFVKLGKLKATNGNQNYEIPAEANLAGMRSAVIWCDRFNVAFGSAPLEL